MIKYEKIKSLSIDEMAVVMAAQFDRCKKYKAHCNQCIADYLNEYPF